MRVSKFSSPRAGPTVGGPNLAASHLESYFPQVEALRANIIGGKVFQKDVLERDAEGIKVYRHHRHQIGGEEPLEDI